MKPKTQQQMLEDCYARNIKTELKETTVAPIGLVKRVLAKPALAMEVARDYASRLGISPTNAEVKRWMEMDNFPSLVEEQVCYYDKSDLKHLR